MTCPRYNPAYNHTSDQIALLEEADRETPLLFQSLMLRARQLYDARVESGTPSDRGDTVRHGANMDLYRRSQYMAQAAGALTWMMDRDLVDLIRYRYRYLGGVFVSDETYAKQYSHIDGEIRRLGAKFLEYVL